jgi:hypothetical protein
MVNLYLFNVLSRSFCKAHIQIQTEFFAILLEQNLNHSKYLIDYICYDYKDLFYLYLILGSNI